MDGIIRATGLCKKGTSSTILVLLFCFVRWFVPEEANSCWSPAIHDSFCRATTYSFGSICFGSFLVALVQALRALANMAREHNDMQLLLCIVECILACIQGIIEYFNQWAYVYVGLYGQVRKNKVPLRGTCVS